MSFTLNREEHGGRLSVLNTGGGAEFMSRPDVAAVPQLFLWWIIQS